MNNYHSHKHYSNVIVADSSVKLKDYAKRAVELGDKILSSLEHGFQGNYFETYQIAKEYGLKFIYGAEAYWVKDRFDKDRTNAHICVFAKTDKGRRALNLALSEANITGFYHRPRLDLDLIMSLPENDIFITTACVAFWKYEDIEEIVTMLHGKFKDNFMLEVQYHHTEKQKDLNKRIIRLSEENGIKIILGMDSHYIYPEQHQERAEVLLSKNVKYPDEDGWFMDYPSDEVAIERLKTQGILNTEQILESIKNTEIFNTFDDFDDIDIFSERIKLPTLYPELSQDEKDILLKNTIWDEWKKIRHTVPKSEHERYVSEIAKEFKIIKDTHMADYFLLDYKIVKRAVENGGEITTSGRGSGVSMYINTILGFSKIDRISAKVKMFPERFMSVSRILESGSLPDLDLNLGNPEVFAEAQREIFGEHFSYPMISYDEFGKKSSWKMYAKAKNVDFSISNAISQSLTEYEDALKYADDDEKDLILIEDYIDEKYITTYRESEVYHGIISGKKAHPCAWLIFDKDIREEIGIMRAVSESTKKETLVCLLDGKSAEKFKFLKNDLLKVDVVKLLYAIARKVGQPIPTERELIDFCEKNPRVYDIYKNGWTVGINQVEKDATTKKAIRYAPRTIEEVCAFVAAIRPSFKSMYKTFEKREYFEYGIPTFDKIIQDTGLDSSFILYQETIMAVLGFAGFPQDETYDIIKAISKKRKKKIDKIKPRFIENFKKLVMEHDGMSEKDASSSAEKVWQIIDDSSAYGFNASHSYSYAYDSLSCAYYKSEYPLYFYETLMQMYTEKGNKKKVQLLRKEMQDAFGLTIKSVKFGNDNRTFTADHTNNSINVNMSSIKGIGSSVADGFFSIKDNKYDSFTDLLYDITTKGIANRSQVEDLIKLNYFSSFSGINKLLSVHSIFYNGDIYKKSTYKLDDTRFDLSVIEKYAKKKTDKQFSGVNFVEVIRDVEKTIIDSESSIVDLIKYQMELIGNVELTYGKDKRRTVVTEYKETEWNKRLSLYCLATGETKDFKLKKKFYRQDINIGDILYIKDFSEEYKLTPHRDENGEIIRNKKGSPESYDKTDEMELLLLNYIIEEDVC